jgi:hypothetical protein
MHFAGIRGALDCAVNENPKRTSARSASPAHPMAPAQEDQGYLAAAPTSQQAKGPALLALTTNQRGRRLLFVPDGGGRRGWPSVDHCPEHWLH